MMKTRPSPLGFMLVLMLGLWAAAAQAGEFRYRYVSLGAAQLPPGHDFFSAEAINNSRLVYGTAYECRPVDTCDVIVGHIAVYAKGVVTLLNRGDDYFTRVVNEEGTVGGYVVTDPVNFFTQAALFRGRKVELVPRRPGEITSSVLDLNDAGTALVESFDSAGARTLLLYRTGSVTMGPKYRKSTLLNFGPVITNPDQLAINNQGIISGTQFVSVIGQSRGFRFDPQSSGPVLLNPVPPDPDAWGVGINERGGVLGYSFVAGAMERIGVWNRQGAFKTYFVEGTPEFPTISNRLVFNDNNLIVITRVSNPPSEVGNSYLVPKPGVRLNLADLVEGPVSAPLDFVWDINDHGDMIGFEFLLRRIGVGKDAGTAATAEATKRKAAPRSIGAAAEARVICIRNALRGLRESSNRGPLVQKIRGCRA